MTFPSNAILSNNIYTTFTLLHIQGFQLYFCQPSPIHMLSHLHYQTCITARISNHTIGTCTIMLCLHPTCETRKTSRTQPGFRRDFKGILGSTRFQSRLGVCRLRNPLCIEIFRCYYNLTRKSKKISIFRQPKRLGPLPPLTRHKTLEETKISILSTAILFVSHNCTRDICKNLLR